MSAMQPGIDYSACTIDELHLLAQNSGSRTSSDYRKSIVRLLQRKDAQAKFPFDKLIPELRNTVYRELLTLRLKDGRMVCFPEILRASKTIYNEASAILYGDNVMSVRVDLGGASGVPRIVSYFSSDPAHILRLDICDTSLYEIIWLNGNEVETATWNGIKSPLDAWPEYLLRFRRWELDIRTFSKADLSSTAWNSKNRLCSPNALLYNLSCFLAQSHNIKHLKIKWIDSGDSAMSDSRYNPLRGTYVTDLTSAWAFCRLFARDNITFVDLDSSIRAKLRAFAPLARLPPMAFNLIDQALYQCTAADVILRHAWLLRIAAEREEALKTLLDHVKTAIIVAPAMDARGHVVFSLSLGALRECLKDLLAPALPRWAEVKMREFVTAYDELQSTAARLGWGAPMAWAEGKAQLDEGDTGITWEEMNDAWDYRLM